MVAQVSPEAVRTLEAPGPLPPRCVGWYREIMATISADDRESLLETLRMRFDAHPERHEGIKWPQVEERLLASPAKLAVLNEMERTDGEPDVVGYDEGSDEFVFVDCSKQSPNGRRGVCYDQAALESRKKHKPETSAMAMADDIGISILSEEEYRALQELGEFDTTTSSWLLTPDDVRNRGGAIFGDHRFGRVFVYHNGAESYYAARGFRGTLRV